MYYDQTRVTIAWCATRQMHVSHDTTRGMTLGGTWDAASRTRIERNDLKRFLHVSSDPAHHKNTKNTEMKCKIHAARVARVSCISHISVSASTRGTLHPQIKSASYCAEYPGMAHRLLVLLTFSLWTSGWLFFSQYRTDSGRLSTCRVTHCNLVFKPFLALKLSCSASLLIRCELVVDRLELLKA